MKIKNIFLISILALILIGCTTTQEASEAYKGESPEYIFQKGEEAMRSRNYGEAIKRFEALDVQYPFGHNTEIAQLHLIYAYYRNSDYPSAESAADRFIRSHPASPYVDYALYMRGISNYYQNLGIFERFFSVDLAKRDLSQIKKSYADFNEIVMLHPTSCYAPAAYQYTVYLRNTLANHQLHVAEYYYSKQAYIAAANRASLVVKHYEGSPVVPCALVIMVKSYRNLQLTQNMNEAMQVLRYNYPNSIYVAEAMRP